MMPASNDSDVFVTLALRYFDGSAGAAEVRELEQLLRASSERRREFLSMAQTTTVLTDHFGIERQGSELEPDQVSSRVLFRLLAGTVALFLGALALWFMSGQGDLQGPYSGTTVPSRSWNPNVGLLSLNFDVISLGDESYWNDSMQAASQSDSFDVDFGFPDAFKLVGSLDFDFVPFNFLIGERFYRLKRGPSPTVLAAGPTWPTAAIATRFAHWGTNLPRY